MVAAAGNAAFAVTRFDANGTLDSSFGTVGTVTTNIAGFPGTSVTAVVVYPGSGQILVGGSASACVKCASDTVLVRYNSDGSLDPAFGNGGTVVVKAISPGTAAPTALALLSNSDILTIAESAIAEFGGNGSLHASVMSTVSGATILATSQGGQTVFQTNGDFIFASSVEGELGRKDIDIQLVASCRKAASTAHSTAGIRFWRRGRRRRKRKRAGNPAEWPDRGRRRRRPIRLRRVRPGTVQWQREFRLDFRKRGQTDDPVSKCLRQCP